MRSNILVERPDAELRVYAVWVDQLGATKGDIDRSVLEDDRVTHFWDSDAKVGTALAPEVGYPGVELWDAYVVFDRGARWAERPEGLVGAGWTVIGDSSRLRDRVDAVLEGM